jgi:hypothetical protein
VNEQRSTASDTSKWYEVAGDRLMRLLESIQRIEGYKLEAERIHAALVAYGLTDLPPLPWAATPVKLLPAGDMRCAVCGRPFTRRAEWRQSGDGPVCWNNVHLNNAAAREEIPA